MEKLYIKQKVFKITDHYAVIDENNNEIYYVDQDFKLIGNTVHVSDRNYNELFTINKVILTWLPKYNIEFTDGRLIEIKENFAFFKKSLEISSADFDLDVKGDYLSLNFKIFNNNDLIGEVEKAWLSWGDTFELTVYDESYRDLVVALTIAVDDILDDEARSRH